MKKGKSSRRPALHREGTSFRRDRADSEGEGKTFVRGEYSEA